MNKQKEYIQGLKAFLIVTTMFSLISSWAVIYKIDEKACNAVGGELERTTLVSWGDEREIIRIETKKCVK